MKQVFEKTVRHIAEWSPSTKAMNLNDFQSEFRFGNGPTMDAEIRIPAGSTVKCETHQDGDDRFYLIYPEFRFRPGVF